MFDLVHPQMGNDPELFVKLGNRVIPSESILEKRHKRIKVDNAAIELQPGPKTCLQEQNKEIAASLALVRKVLKDGALEKAHISVRPVEQLRSADIEEFRTVCMFGCQPSLVFDGRELSISKPNADPQKVRYRSVGYHVHVGMERPELMALHGYSQKYVNAAKILHTTEGRVRLVQVCDLLVGLPAVLLERDYRVPIRRQVLGYGKAGEFREQPHGFEYRTLGSWPLLHPMWGWWANAAVRDCLQLVANDLDQQLKTGIDLVKVAEVINTNNLAGALEYWHRAKINLLSILQEINPKKDWDYAFYASHPLLDQTLIKRLDFLALRNDLKRRLFNFNLWCARRKMATGYTQNVAFLTGFPSGSDARVKESSDWTAFEKEWAMDRDLISKQLLA